MMGMAAFGGDSPTATNYVAAYTGRAGGLFVATHTVNLRAWLDIQNWLNQCEPWVYHKRRRKAMPWWRAIEPIRDSGYSLTYQWLAWAWWPWRLARSRLKRWKSLKEKRAGW